jgi:hypothetical protein
MKGRLTAIPVSLLLGAFLISGAMPARAEIALLENGMTFKIVGRRIEADTVFLALKGGGEIGTPVASVRGFVPDEVLDEVPPSGNMDDLRTMATAVAQRQGLDPALVLAVVAVESGFRAEAVSPKGARGLMQLMPATAAALGVSNAFDPAANLDGGTRHLGALMARYGGDLKKALAAYNAGTAAVDVHRGIPPYPETRDYVAKVLDRYQKGR